MQSPSFHFDEMLDDRGHRAEVLRFERSETGYQFVVRHRCERAHTDTLHPEISLLSAPHQRTNAHPLDENDLRDVIPRHNAPYAQQPPKVSQPRAIERAHQNFASTKFANEHPIPAPARPISPARKPSLRSVVALHPAPARPREVEGSVGGCA
ncbi:MAG TPA: hypothetical protein VLC09_13165 [Polyangiaceae bacterium]|nr:hypothetical protein [Polyangiaceae bacterium]